MAGTFATVIVFFCLYATNGNAQQPFSMNVMTFDWKNVHVEFPQNLFDHLTQGTIETWVKWEKFNK